MADLVQVKVTGNVGTIEDNLDAVEASIREKVKEYSAVVVTEDSIADGRKFRADIRKEKDALDEERKAIKKQWMKPYDEFEKRAKKIIALYDEPIQALDEQLKAYEEERKKAKRQEIQETYDLAKGDLGDWLPLERIYNPKWENKTCTGKVIREDMEALFDQLRLSISTIESMKSEFEEDALRVLKETGNLQEAIAEISRLQAQKERFLEQARREVEQKRLEEDRLKAEREQEEAERLRKEQELAEENRQNAVQQEVEELPFPDGEEAVGTEDMLFPDEDPFEMFADEEPFGTFPEDFGTGSDDPDPFDSAWDSFDPECYIVTVRVPQEKLDTLKSLLEQGNYEYEVR